ncbi:TetR/AcrR family transcriptional regulator C-terminal domain-containing protein [Streptomyces griseoviridis]|jgi:TetR/AcrR family tetracycline transcriptional repressor|uniref:TetR/AcrR family tetracycline transcriptional repressor n=3 Tax=Streptomyces TaxID=1883 RepID=A0ABT9LRK6_STRGD|nr:MULTISPECIES: TetR/AcrR family transcriptional regulator C-terminal domain-containing protein [Streptomyces]MDP9686176.1 TetR/AcrR family tetracycline transcriptional repressor [Streptomyces griseoviridis]GGS45786.1 TetR family transcriptional regulator [Streptomyces niveoruber]GGS79932.1 TetR family transcriptional regulator [Streptomyces griseoviridis]GGU17294.1 TetR family transcriptional regulator [Streptomyces daghestanicus]GHI35463.1 TetR family transcriptional regulator [Streptomyces
MTKRQTGDRLAPDTVVRAALDLLDEKGLEALSARAVADRLGVRMNTVLWHVKTKARMLDLMADAVVGEAPLDGLPDEPRERAREVVRRYRRALLAHRDGAALVVGTYVAEPHTLRLAETLVAALLDAGLDERGAAWTTWTVLYFTLGLTQEQQAAERMSGDRLERAVTEAGHPALHRVLGHLASGSFEERFEYGLDAVLGGR